MALTLLPVPEDEAFSDARRRVLAYMLVEVAIERIAKETPDKTITVVFDPSEPENAALYSNASADRIAEVLLQMALRVQAGGLRMPVTGGTRWVDEGEQG